MKIVHIFGQHLFAFKYKNQANEFERLFDYWADVEELEAFFENNKDDLRSPFWAIITVEEAIFCTINDAQKLEDKLRELSVQVDPTQNGLETIFQSLDDRQIQIVHLNKSKAKRRWLRIYALRIESNVYVITGGAIKLTHEMKDRGHTRDELQKIEKCRNFLIDAGIIDKDGITEAFEIC
jgi:hypothetical protein